MSRRIPNLYSIAAVGNSGQLGYDGVLPWEPQPDDMKWFREQTTGGILLCGKRTFLDLVRLEGTYGRDVIRFRREHTLDQVREMAKQRTLWVCGGASLYHYFAPFVSRMLFGMIDYDGPADTFFPKPWQAMSRFGEEG